MLVPNIQYEQRLDLHPRNQVVGYPNIPFGFTNWMPFTRCTKKGIVVKWIQFGHVPESTQHLESARLDNRTVQQPPVEEPPNQPKKPSFEEPGNLPERPPMPGEPPVEEPPNEPDKPPVKEPPPKDPDREPPHKPPVRAMPDMVIILSSAIILIRFLFILKPVPTGFSKTRSVKLSDFFNFIRLNCCLLAGIAR